MKLRQLIRKQRRVWGAESGWPWFRAGYRAALDDIERTGLQPTTDKTKRESADRALKRWISTGVFVDHEADLQRLATRLVGDKKTETRGRAPEIRR